MERSKNQDYYDLCYVYVAPFVTIRDQWTPARLAQTGVRYGDHLLHVGMWAEPWYITEGYAGKKTLSGINNNRVVPMYANIGPGSSGGGVWNREGELVGLLVQARLFRTMRGGAMPMGLAYFLDLTD